MAYLTVRRTVMALFTCCAASSAMAGDNPANRYLDAYKAYTGATCPVAPDHIKNFIYFARDREAIHGHALLTNTRFLGAQIMYPWRALEPKKGVYDFSAIRADLDYLDQYHKKLFIQLQDESFNPAYKPVPDYLLAPEYSGGVMPRYGDGGSLDGWVARRWDPTIHARFAALLNALGKEFDGEIEGLNLQESAADVSEEKNPGFSAAFYAEGLAANMRALKAAFPKSTTMQYANFMPGEWLPWTDNGYLRGLYKLGEEIGVGLGAPDLMVLRKGQLNHAYAMMHENRFTVPLGIAVQDGNYIGQTNNTDVVDGHQNIVPMLYAFAAGFLHVDYIFWANQKPYFTEDVLPCLTDK